MPKYEEILSRYYQEIGHHELLGPEGEIALAKQIEEREIEVWRRLLSYAPALPVVLDTLEEGGMRLPIFRSLREAAETARDAPNKANKAALADKVDSAAAQIREADRDRTHLAEVLPAIDSQVTKGRGRSQWRRGVNAAERAAADSRQRFVNSNLRLVVRICRKYAGHGVPFEDLIQEGNIGLIKGVDRFDYRKGYRFSTYAGWWIRHAIGRAVANTSRAVRVPVHVLDTSQQITRAARELTSELGRSPTNEEIAERCEISPEKVAFTRSRAHGAAVSLNEPLGEEGTTRMDLMADPANDEHSVLDDLLGSQEVARVGALLEHITPIQADVLRKRFGLGDNPPMTLQKIADGYSLSRERIRQIERAALQSLRAQMEKEDRLPEKPPARRAAAR